MLFLPGRSFEANPTFPTHPISPVNKTTRRCSGFPLSLLGKVSAELNAVRFFLLALCDMWPEYATVGHVISLLSKGA